MCRSEPACVLVTWPNWASPNVLSGVPNCGVLARLKLSARNCSFQRSVNGKSLKIERSTERVGGEKLVCKPRLPWVRGVGAVRLAVLNHSTALRPPSGAALGSVPDTRSGEQPPDHTPIQPLARRV